MKVKAILVLGLVLASAPTWAATGYLRDDDIVTTVTGRMAHRCTYDLWGNVTAVVMENSCPLSMEFE